MEGALKMWTVMVYLAGDNSLDGAGVVDLREMKKVGTGADIAVLAQFDRSGKTRTTKRYVVKRAGEIEGDVVEDLGETNTGDPGVLKDFILWGARNYPAEHYLVVIWNHGSGWDDENIYRSAATGIKISRKGICISDIKPGASASRDIPFCRLRSVSGSKLKNTLFSTSILSALTTRAIAFDDSAKDFLDNLEIKKVFSGVKKVLGRKIDIIGMDACLMNMMEVMYQVKDFSLFGVGSEETEPGDGWPYDKVLSAIASRPSMTPREVSEMIVNRYIKSYPASENVTLSSCDLSKASSAASSLSGLSSALVRGMSDSYVKGALMQTRNQVQSYYTPDYVDIVDFCSLLKANCARKEIRGACDDVVGALGRNGMIAASACKGSEVRNSHGLSIYFPTRKISPLYVRLDFVKKTKWGTFLKEYLGEVTRR